MFLILQMIKCKCQCNCIIEIIVTVINFEKLYALNKIEKFENKIIFI